MPLRGKNTRVVDPGHQPLIFATGVAAIDRADEYVQITFCQDQLFGGAAVQEREIQGRLVLTRSGVDELIEALGLGGMGMLPAH